MPLFRNSDSSGERSASDREHARLEREARRRGVSVDDLLRERGELAPEPVVEPEPEPEPYVEPEPEPEPPPPEPEPEPYVEPEPVAQQPPAPTPGPEPEDDIDWTDTRQRDVPAPPPAARRPDPEPDPEPTSAWDQPPAPGATGDFAAPVGDDLPPKELDPPVLPASRSARPLPRAPRRRYAQPDARRSPAQGPVKRKRSWFARIFAVVLLVVVVAVVWFLFNLFQPFKSGGEGTGKVAVTVPSGASVRQIGDLLADKDVVSSGFYFDLRTRLSGNRGDFKAGTYTLAHDMSYSAAMDALTKPKTQPAVPTSKITIPEGRSRREIAAEVNQDGLKGSYLAASEKTPGFNPTKYGAPKDTASLEGFLFPATYELPKRGATSKELVAQQVKAFKDNIAGVSMAAAKKKNLTTYDVLIIASMVEREAQSQKDRPLVAAVIYNRLKDKMPLGIDATTRFELNNWTSPLKESELTKDTPYNTRTRRGLPPTPIGNPGLASIKAAAKPANVDYLYYVAKPGTCSHNFSSTNEQFQKDVQTYNQARDANGGKSPTTC